MNGPARFVASALLKRDLFGTIERGRFEAGGPAGEWVRRDPEAARAWLRPLARWLARREARALAAVATRGAIRGVPRVRPLARDGAVADESARRRSSSHCREWIEGAPMQVARPRDRAFFRAARRLLVALHRRGVVHDDLAKEANWLVAPDGSPALVDFQLAWVARDARRRGALFRMAAREDLRHLAKHKRTYRPDALTDRERRLLATPSWPARAWRATGKRAYWFVTRKLLRWSDREGASERTTP